MTQEELVAQLRDIHLPADTTAAVDLGFALWPIIVLALLLGSVVVVRYWRRTAWRRLARASLTAIEAERDLELRWSSLTMLAAQIARRSGRPDIVPRSAYRNPETITDADAKALGAHLRKEIVR